MKNFILNILNELEYISKEAKNLSETIHSDLEKKKGEPIYSSKAKVNRVKLNIRDSFRRIEKQTKMEIYRYGIEDLRKDVDRREK